MNTKLALTAIAMFAVMMGLSSVVPAIAEPGNPKSKATTEICHYAEEELLLEDTDGDGIPDTPVLEDTDGDGIPDSPIVLEPAHWMFLFVNGKGAANGHIGKHGDGTDTDFEIIDQTSRDRCQTLVDATATP